MGDVARIGIEPVRLPGPSPEAVLGADPAPCPESPPEAASAPISPVGAVRFGVAGGGRPERLPEEVAGVEACEADPPPSAAT